MISIILPTRNRPKLFKNVLDNIKITTNCIHEVICLINSDDKESQIIADNYQNLKIIITNPNLNAIEKWNLGAKDSNFEWLFPIGDDIVLPINWDFHAFKSSTSNFIAIHDQTNKDRNNIIGPFFITNKIWLRKYQNGVLLVPHYKAWGPDSEICERAIRANNFTILTNIFITHNHPIWGLGEKDKTFLIAQKHWKDDLELLAKRRVMNFPNDFEGYL